MAFREKAAWVSLAITLLVWAPYFWRVAGQVESGSPDLEAVTEWFVRAVVLSVVLSIATSIALGLAARRDADAPADERERLFDLRSTSVAYVVLTVGVVGVALATPMVAGAARYMFERGDVGEVALVVANGALCAVILAEIVRNLCQIVQYRRGR